MAKQGWGSTRIARVLSAGAIVFGLCASCTPSGASRDRDAGPLPVGQASLVRFDDVAPGDVCPAGGQRLSVGRDVDGDGKLADDEVEESEVLCHGQPGAEAAVDLLRLTPGELEECGGAGVLVEVGADVDGDLELDEQEVRQRGAICAGADGANGGDALVELADSASCPDGGQEVRAGYDHDADGALDENEILTRQVVCSAPAGADAGPAGADGVDALVEVTPAQASCPAGGQRLSLGWDLDGSGALDEGEVRQQVLLCNAVPGEGGSVGPGAGLSEGSLEAPVPLLVTPLADLAQASAGSVAARGTSVYAFTTRSGHGEMPYSLAFFEVEGPLQVSLLERDSQSPAGVDCVAETLLEVESWHCRTAALPPGGDYVVVVRELQNVPNSYLLTVSAGAAEGQPLAPRPLDVTGVEDAPQARRVSVSAARASYYALELPFVDQVTLALDVVDAPDGDPTPSVALYRGYAHPERLLATCVAAPCVAPRVPVGELLVVALSPAVPRGAAMDLRLSRGDGVTPSVPLDTVVPLAPVMQLWPISAGGYSLYFGRGGFRVHGDLPPAAPVAECDGFAGDSCYLELEGERRYYVALLNAQSDGLALVRASAGNQGSVTAPVPLTLDEDTEISTESGAIGDLGVLFGESHFSFTPTSAGVHELRFAWLQPALDTPEVRLYEGVVGGLARGVQEVRREEGAARLLTEPLEAGQPHHLVVGALDALRATLRVAPGDTSVLALPLDDTALTGPNLGWRRVELPSAGALVLTASGLASQLRFSAHQGSPAAPWPRAGQLASDGTTYLPLPAGTHYVTSSGGGGPYALRAVFEPASALALGAPRQELGVPPGERRWFTIEVSEEAIYRVALRDLELGGSRDIRFAFYDPLGGVTVSGAGTPNTTLNLWSGGGAAPAIAGTWSVYVQNDDEALALDVEIEVMSP